MTARLILVCHASTDAVRKAAFPVDEPLDDSGKQRASALAGHLPDADLSWTSPELRTRQTAAALQLTAIEQPALRDCDYGVWRGRTFDDVLAHERQVYQQLLTAIQALPDMRFLEPWKPGGRSLIPILPSQSYTHYQTHLPTIKKWLTERKK